MKISLSLKSKLYRATSLLFLLLLTGVTGFYTLTGMSLVDALYMTVITITTVGFGEVVPLSQEARLFTVFLILISMVVLGYAITVLTEYIIEGEFFKNLKYKSVQKKIKQLKNHTIVCGYGRNGKQAVSKLLQYGKEVVVIEDDEKIIEELQESGLPFIEGDATKDEVLYKAGLKNAAHLITTLPSDADNLFVVLSARQQNKHIKIVSRASDDTTDSKLRIAGANNVIMPDKIGGDHMASLIVTPDIIEFVDKLSTYTGGNTYIKEIAIDDLPAEFSSKSIRDLDLRRKTGCLIIGYKTPDNKYIVNPDPGIKMMPHAKLIVLGNAEQVKKLNEMFKAL